eukprot:g3349.t1
MEQTPPKKDEQSRSAAGPSSEDVRSEFRSMAESRLQGILKSFGRVEELFNVGQSTGKRIKDIVENLNSQDMNKIRLATDDLNNLLNNTAEDAYSTFPIDQLMPALVNCMSLDDDVDVTLKAIRCLGTFARSLPSSCSSMVSHGAVPALCTRLLSMEVIDVAEESIRAIKYISKESPESCLTNGALCAVLSYLDFFSQHERRDAVESAAHMCHGLKAENCDLVIDQVPTLVNLLGYEDAVLVEKAALALLRICEASVGNLEILTALSETQLVEKSMELISGVSASPLKSSTFFGLIKILTLCSGNNAQIAEILLSNNISEILHSLLLTNTTEWRPGSNSTLIQTPEHLVQILELTNSLLPKEAANEDGHNQSMQLTDVYKNSPLLISKFGSDLLPVLLQVHDLTASQPVRASVLLIWSKVVKLMDKESFQSIVGHLRICSLLGPLLMSSQEEVVIQAMGLVQALIEKLPETFRTAFLREGVVHAISHLAEEESDIASAASVQAKNFLQTHFSEFSADEDSEGVNKMKSIASKLEFHELSEASLKELVHLINEEGISTFEFLRSSLIEALNQFLNVPESVYGAQLVYSAEELLINVRQFVEIGLSLSSRNGSSPLQGLVHKLQDSISACEGFPVRHIIRRHVRNPGPASKTGSDELKTQNLRLASLGQPLKLKLERNSDEMELKELPQSQVLVEPLVIMHALEEYLWPKVKPSESTNKPVASNQSMEVDATEQQSSSSLRRERSSVRRSGGGIIHRSKFQPPATKSSPSAGLSHSPHDSEAMSLSHDESEEAEVYHEDDLILDDEDEDLDDELSEEDDDEDDEDEEEELDDEDEMEAMTRVHNLELNSEVDEMEESTPTPAAGGGGARASSSSTANEQTYPGMTGGRSRAFSEIEFCIGDVVIKPQATIFQTIRESIAMKLGYEDELEGKQSKISNFRHKWEDTHTITYRSRRTKMDCSPSDSIKHPEALSGETPKPPSRLAAVLDLLQKVSLPDELEVDDDLRQILLLMKLLDTINSIATRFGGKCEIRPLSRSEFISSKLSTKLSQQIQDPLTVCSSSTPPWTKHLVTSCKFLFPFELRRKFFYCRLGAPRALVFFNKEYEALGEKKDSLKVERGDHGEVRLSKLKSMKVRVSRSKILSTAMKVMESYGHNCSDVIEVQYFNESGVGEGPTLEFYTLISQELQQKNLQMWRDESIDGNLDSNTKNESTELVHASKGLFPRPYTPGQTPPKIVRLFGFMGKTIARALIDGRLMDLNINPLFFRILRNEQVDLYDIQSIDSHLGSSLEQFQEALDTQQQEGGVRIDGASLEDICLPFTLPGYDDYPLSGLLLKSETEFVHDGNLQSYINSVVNGTLQAGIDAQMKAFKDGFQSVLPLEMLEIFYDDELDLLLRGSQGCWTIEELSESVHFSHGYSPLCDQARWFLEILSELDDQQRRSFLQFLTGSPRLPPGGIGALSPKLTVVQRLNNSEGSSENDLPSVATCVNFLKLPKYGSKQVMKDRLIIAFNEGQYAFDLS